MATVALDAMGGDDGACVVVPAALAAVQAEPALRVILVGDRAVIRAELERRSAGRELEQADAPDSRLRIVHASEQVLMEEAPAHALRSKRDSSMRVAINLVKRGEADACVSAGNTGALMAIARFVLKTLPGIDRPAIISQIPCLGGHIRMLDLGASVDASPEQLYQFAVMGAVMAHAADGIDRPSVGLLNVGEESIKGNDRVKRAAALLSASHLNYIGFVEGDDIYKGTCNVVVCDGFSGNVCLKSSEGVAKMIAQLLRTEFERSILTRLAGLIARPVLGALKARIDPRRYNGATLIGLRGIVVKSHGGADAFAFRQAIFQAVTEIKKNVPDMISAHLEPHLEATLTHEEAV